jgi:orotate phosphoribosyltransferase
MSDYKAEFVEFAIASNVLCFGEFKTKAGRMSPYFFNAGLFNDGDRLKRLGEFYAKAIVDSGIAFDVLFGPAYKGIPLVASIAIALDRMERGTGEKSAVQEAREQFGIPVVAVVTLDNLVEFLGRDANRQQELQAVARYRAQYGV